METCAEEDMREQQLRVLLVDSDEDQCRSLEKRLAEANGYLVATAGDARQAWEMVATPDTNYQVVLINDTLASRAGEQPASIGVELKQRIKTGYPDTDVVIYTGCGLDRGCDSLRAPELRCLGRSFSTDQLATLVHQAADQQRLKTAVENARLLKEARHRAEQLEALHRTTVAIGAYLDRRTLLEMITRQAVSLVRARSGNIYEYHPDRRELSLAVDNGGAEDIGIILKVGEGMAGRLVASGLPYKIVDDYSTWEDRAPIYDGRRKFEAVLQVLLKSDGRVLGVLSVDDGLSRRFNEEDARLLSQFADHAAIALGSAELAERDAKKARRLQTLSQISSEIVSDLSSMNLQQRLNLIARRAVEVLEAEACGILLVRREGYLSWQASYGHAEGVFIRGKEFAIVSRPKGGLTGHIAKEGLMFNAWGSALTNHFAVKKEEKDHIAPEHCYSLLALPLKNKDGELVGLLRVENKLGSDRAPDHGLHFTPDDELILNNFGQAVVVAIDAAALVDELKENKDHLKRLVDSSPNGIISVDTEGRVTGFNRRAAEIQGYTADEVTDWPVSRLYWPREEPRQIGKLLRLSQDGKLTGHQTHVLSKNGERIPIRLSATWLYDANENRIGSVGYFEDLRSTKAAERRHDLLLKASNALADAEDLTDGLSRLAQLMVSLLHHSFCRILLVDESGLFLVTEAVYPSPSDRELGWEPGLKARIPMSKWPELPMVLLQGTPVVRSFRDEGVRDRLQDFSRQLGLRETIQSLLLVPLKIDNRLIGLLDLGELRSEELSKFTEEDIRLAAAIAAQTTMLIERMRLLEQARNSGEKLRELFEASNALVSDRNIQGTLEDIVERTRVAAEAGLVRVIIIDPTGEARLHAISGTQFREFRLTDALRQNGISMEVMEKRQARWIEDVTKEEPGYVNSEYLEAGIEAAICFPLLRQGKPMGVMWISYDHPRYFSSEQKRSLQLYVNQAAIACGNAWRIDEMWRLHRAAERMSRPSDLAAVLQSVVDQAQELFQADSCALSPYDHALERFIPDQFVGTGIREDVLRVFREEDPKEDGITHTVRKTKYLAVSNVDKEERELMRPEMRYLLRKAEINGFHGVVLQDGDECLGVLYVSYSRPQEFTGEDARRLKDFATYAALSVRKARLLDQVDKARKAAAVVARAAAQGNIETTLSSVAEGIQAGLDADAVTLYALSQSDGRLKHLPGVAGLNHREEALLYESINPGSAVHTILGRDKARIVENVADDPDFGSRPFAIREGIQSCCGVPLKAKDRTVGVMFVNYRTRHRFTADELGNIDMFANQAGVAIANTQLFEELAEQLTERDAHLRLSERLIACTSLREILDHAVVVACEALGTDSCNIVLRDYRGNLILRAAIGWPAELVGKRVPRGNKSQAGFTIETRESVIAYDYSEEKRFALPPEAKESGVKSGLSVPMFRGEDVVGSMIVQTKHSRRFSKADAAFLSLIANTTAIAVQRGEHFEAAARKSAGIQALYEAGKAIADASRGLERKQILDRIVEQAVKSVARGEGPKPVFGTLQLYDAKQNELVFESVYPRQELPGLVERLGERRALYRGHRPGWKIGITGRTVIEKRAQLVADITKEETDYLSFNPGTQSELTVPLFDHGSERLFDGYPVLGVLNVESDQLAAFDSEDVDTLSTLAEFAGIAIENAKQYDEMKKVKGLVGSRTSLAWMGMTSNHWRHTVQGHATTIRDHTLAIRRELGKKFDSTIKSRIESQLTEISELARLVEQHPITAPLSSEEGAGSVLVNALLRERIGQLMEDARYKYLKVKFELTLQEDSTIRVSPEWLKKALDVLVDNAAEGMKDSSEKSLTIGTVLSGNLVEIRIEDKGRGVPDSIRSVLLKERIEKPKGSKGLGMGLLMAQCIVQTFDGEIRLESTSPSGTVMVINLPREA